MLTQDEAELYDRQIRLWGVNAQNRLRRSKVLMIGFDGVASEIAKILVLAGIDTLAIIDDSKLQESDLSSNLFCRPELNETNQSEYRTHKVKDKLRTLNPLVKVNIDNSSIHSKNQEYFQGYDLVTLHQFMTLKEINSINKICRDNDIKFYLVLDFGYFGFIFNDLGSKFKFSYEEYNNSRVPDHNGSKPIDETGDTKNPINVDDDEENCERQDSDRPKKRRRHHSPSRPADVRKEIDERKQKVDELFYVPFGDMISFDETRFDKNSSPVLFISIALLKFYSENGRIPVAHDLSKGDSEDISELNRIIASFKDNHNLHEGIFRKLDHDWSRKINSHLSPICAIVGGVAGQDMIRSLSNKDIPICNTFSFNGIDMSGVVERVGCKGDKNKVTPIVRDYLEID